MRLNRLTSDHLLLGCIAVILLLALLSISPASVSATPIEIDLSLVGSDIGNGQLGDTSCDGAVNTIDALFILQFNVGLKRVELDRDCPLLDQNDHLLLSACDVSNDAICNTTDALFILQCNVLLSNDFCPAPDPIPDPGPAQVWQPVITNEQPPVETSIGLSHDDDRGVTVLYSGEDEWPYTGSTWEYDGAVWREQGSAAPDVRYGTNPLFDPNRGSVILFGGSDIYDNDRDETWAYDGSSWIKLSPALSPPARTGHTTVFESQTGLTYLFGGNAQLGAVYFNDLWAFDGTSTTWSELSTNGTPPPRTQHGLAAGNGELLLFGGRGPDGGALGDTWLYDLTTSRWTKILGGAEPPRRSDHVLVFNPDQNHYILLGGTPDGGDSWHADAWRFSTAAGWESLSLVGPDLSGPFGVAYDDARQAFVLIVNGETWELDGAEN